MYGVAHGFSGYGVASSAPPTLRQGDKDTYKGGAAGSWVTTLQSYLMGKGYALGAGGLDGIYGRTTASAVRSFQIANGISATGVADGATWEKLGFATRAPGTGVLSFLETLATTIAPFTPAGQERILDSQRQQQARDDLQVYQAGQAQTQEIDTRAGEQELWKKIALFGGIGVGVLLLLTVVMAVGKK